MNDQARPSTPSSAWDRSSSSLVRLPLPPSGAMSVLPPVADLCLRVAYLADLGRVRDHQEDAVGVTAPADPALLATKGCLLIVADGMGGHQAGEVASQLAVAEIQRAYYAHPGDDLATSLAHALAAANQAIYRQAQATLGERGMGTTVAVAAVRGRAVQVASVGDSRVYLLRGRTITQVTEDHSWAASQVRAGILTPAQAASHPQRNLITRAVGQGPTVEPDLFSGVLQAGDVLLLCSDGLTRHVTDRELLDIASTHAPDVAVRRLVDLANQRGGSDNISVIVASATPAAPGVAEPVAGAAGAYAAAGPARPLWLAAAILLIIGSVLIAAALLLRQPSGRPAPKGSMPGAASTITPGRGAAVATAPVGAATVTLAAVATPAHAAPAPSPAVQNSAPPTPVAPTAAPNAQPRTPTPRPPAQPGLSWPDLTLPTLPSLR